MADGSINFDTSIDTEGVNKATSLLKGRFKQLGKEIQNAFGGGNSKNKAAIDKLKGDVDKATQAYDNQIKKIEELKKKLEDLEAEQKKNSESAVEFTPSEKLQGLMDQSKAKYSEYMKSKGKYDSLKAVYGSMSPEAQYSGEGAKLQEDILKEKKNMEAIKKEYSEINAKADELSAKEEAAFEKQKAAAEAQKQNKDAQLAGQIDSTNSAIEEETAKLDGLKAKADSAKESLNDAMNPQKPTLFGKAIGGASKAVKSIGTRLAGMAKRVLVFSLIIKALEKVMELFSNAFGQDSQISASLARIKGNILTAFQPLWEAVQPVLLKILAIIETITAKLAQYMSAVFGKSTSQMSANAKAMNAETEATEEAEKALAGFDTIQQLGSDSSSGDSSGSGADFSGTSNLDELDKKTATIMTYGSMILGVACLLVGIALVNIPLIITGIGLIAAGIAIGGNSGVFDSIPQWVHNIIGWGTMLLGVALIIIGFATMNITMIISGFALLAVGIAYSVKTGVFTSTLEAIKGAWDNVKNICVTKWAALKSWWATNITPIWTALKTVVSEVWQAIKAAINGNMDSAKAHMSNAMSAIKTVWVNTWNLIKNAAKSAVNFIIGVVEGLVNGVIKGINWLIDKLNALSAKMPDWVKEHTVIGNFSVSRLNEVSIPRLASGTVVPANNGEFAAILGDNKSETEVVSPLSTMKQALKEALQESGGMGISNITLTIANRTISEATIDYINGKSKQLGVNVIKAV